MADAPKFEDTLPIEEGSDVPKFEDTLELDAPEDFVNNVNKESDALSLLGGLSPTMTKERASKLSLEDQQKYMRGLDMRKNVEGGLQALLAGLTQGATLGLSDEGAGAISELPESALGAAKAASSLVTGNDVSQDPDVQKYTLGRDQSRQEFDAIKQDNPGTVLAGEALGGLATPAGTFKRGAGALSSLIKMLGVGTTAGVGISEGDLAKGENDVVLEDAAIGGGIASALPVAGMAGKATLGAVKKAGDVTMDGGKFLFDKLVKGSSMGDEIEGAVIAADRGLTLTGKDADTISQSVLDNAKNIDKFITEKVTGLRKQRDELLKSKSDVKIKDLGKSILAAEKEVDDLVKAGAIDKNASESIKAGIREQAYLELPSTVKDAVKKTTTTVTKQVPDEGSVRSQIIKEKSKNIEGMPGELQPEQVKATSLEEIRPMTDMGIGEPTISKAGETVSRDLVSPGQLLEEGSPQQVKGIIDYFDNLYSKAKPEVRQIYSKLRKQLSGNLEETIPEVKSFNQPMSAGLEAREVLGSVDRSLNAPALSTPSSQAVDFVQRAGSSTKTPQQLGEEKLVTNLLGQLDQQGSKKLLSEASDVSKMHQATKQAQKRGIETQSQIVGSARAITVRAANLARRGNNYLSQKSLKVAPTNPGLSKALAQVASTEDQVKRNALLFAIMQNPNYRKDMEDDESSE